MQKSIYQKTTEVYDNLGKKYLEKSKKAVPEERLPFSKLFTKGAKILEAGCGGGRDAKFFARKGFKVFGIDVSHVLVKIAKKEVPRAKFECIDLRRINFPARTFDGIWAHAVLLHLKRKDVPGVLKKFYKILKNGGTLHLALRKGQGEAFIKDNLSGGQKRFYTYFSKSEIVGMLEKQGFKVVYIKIAKDDFGRNISWIRIWARK